MKVHAKPATKIAEADLQEFFIMTNHWLKDIDFFSDEIRFFQKIIRDYIADDAAISKYRMDTLKSHLSAIEMEKHALRVRLLNHKEKLDLLIRKILSDSDREIKEEQSDLEIKIAELMKTFRKFKEELFNETKDIIDLQPGD